MSPINNVPLSASRLKKAQMCSWQYWCSYILCLPDKSNDGAKRGSICHLVFECLGKWSPKRQAIYDAIIDADDPFISPPIKRLILKHAKRDGIDDEANLDSIREMICNGLGYDFFGDYKKDPPDEAISEMDFDLNIQDEESGKNYRIKGFIDKLFLYKKKSFALIRDFKSSKSVFSGKEITDNMQDLMYSLAVKHLRPEYKNRISEFLFLKFELDPDDKDCKGTGVVSMKPLHDLDLEGFEYQLTEMQKYINNFSIKDAKGNMAYDHGYPKDKSFGGLVMCGRAKFAGEKKKNGEPMWFCPMKFAFDYYEVKNADGKIVKSYFVEDFDESLVPEGCTFSLKHYSGCPAIK